MRKFILSILAATSLAACQPETYTGSLDSPIGNWDGVKAEYYFAGDWVAEVNECEYSAVSFYEDGLCCIEGVKGAFPYTYDNSTGLLTVDNTAWAVQTLTGAEMVLEYLETIFSEEGQEEQSKADSAGEPEIPEEPGTPEGPETPEIPEVKPDENGLILPIEYNGVSINADENGYYYESGHVRVYCKFYAAKDESGAIIKDESGAVAIEFWYDSHIDHFIPLVVEVKK